MTELWHSQSSRAGSVSFNAGPSAQLPTGPEADLPSSRCRGALGETARHPLESFTPTGLVLLALLVMSAGLVLAVLLKLLSMALSVSH